VNGPNYSRIVAKGKVAIMAVVHEALLIVDMQQGFDEPWWGQRNNPRAEQHGLRVLEISRMLRHQVVFVRHDSLDPTSPLRPGLRGHAFKPGFEPEEGEWVIGKNFHSAFIRTDLEARLRAMNISRLAVFGITTDQCVSTTVRMASDLGFQTTLIEDACACFSQVSLKGMQIPAELIHIAHVTSLLTEFAQVQTAEAFERSLF
jgi:nicotinamidase-related amidase